MPAFWWSNSNTFPAWPVPAKTDAEGCFVVHGVGQQQKVSLTARHPRFALQQFQVETDGSPASKPITRTLSPAQLITGRATYAGSGKPAAGARVAVQPRTNETISAPFSFFDTDADGRFRMNPPPGDRYRVAVWPPTGLPYLVFARNLEWPKGSIEQSLDFVIPRGVAIRGRVTDERTGEPIAGAALRFTPQTGRQTGPESGNSSPGVTGADGSFQLGAVPSAGTLLATGPSDEYVYRKLDKSPHEDAQPLASRAFSHASAVIAFKPGVESIDVNMTFRKGITVKGKVVAPDGQPVASAWILSRIIMEPAMGSTSWQGGYHRTSSRDGHFEIHGFDKDDTFPVCFLHPERKLGAIAVISSKSAAIGPLTIRLEPCGSARARVVDASGKPLEGPLRRSELTLIVAQHRLAGATQATIDLFDRLDRRDLDFVDPINYKTRVTADGGGRVTLPVLIPGTTYRFSDQIQGQRRISAEPSENSP